MSSITRDLPSFTLRIPSTIARRAFVCATKSAISLSFASSLLIASSTFVPNRFNLLVKSPTLPSSAVTFAPRAVSVPSIVTNLALITVSRAVNSAFVAAAFTLVVSAARSAVTVVL